MSDQSGHVVLATGDGTAENRLMYCDDEGNDYDVLNTIEEWKQLRALIAIAKCPNESCIDGSIPVQVSDDDWEAQQCQWCYERAAILYGDGK
jgi:hypothetical protein